MKKIFFIALFLISALNCFGQQVMFQKTYGSPVLSSAHSVIQTIDGGYLMAGEHHFSPGNSTIYLVKTDSQGNILWTKAIDSTSINRAYSVKQTSDGGYIIAGAKDSVPFFHYIYLVKTDSIGSVQWAKTFAGSGGNAGYSVIQSFDGGYLVTGCINNFMVGLIKTDGSGNITWDKAIDIGASAIGFSVMQTSDSGFVVCGIQTVGINNDYLILFKTNSMGIMLWDKIYGGPSIWGNSVSSDTDGGIIVAGATDYFGAGNTDMLLLKTDNSGNLLWAKSYGNSGDEGAYSGLRTSDNGYLLLGSRDSSLSGYYRGYAVKTDSAGNVVWSKEYEFSPGLKSLTQTADGGYVFTGAGAGNVILIKTDSLGNSGCYETNISTQSFIAAIPANSSFVNSDSAGLTSSSLSPYTISIGTDSTLCTTVGISPAQSASGGEGVAIAPNPTTNNFTITFPNPINKGSIEIYNVLGKKIFEIPIAIGTTISQKEIHLENIASGIYFVKVRVYPDLIGNREKEYSGKVVIE